MPADARGGGDLAPILADDDGVAHAAARGVGERREILALALAARDEDDALAERLERFDRRGDVRALGVVVELHARDVPDELDPVRDGAEARHGPADGRRRRCPSERAGGGRQHVLDVVDAAQLDLGQRDDAVHVAV